ncbi:MAG: hypothetical protein WD096_07055 [Actinomycetota bacterium]
MSFPLAFSNPLDLIEHVQRSVADALDLIDHEPSSPDETSAMFDMYALLDRDAAFSAAHLALDVLATELADRFGVMRLAQPTAYMADVLLHARVAGPSTEAFRAGLQDVMEATLRQVLGTGTALSIGVVPASEPSNIVATLQALFPRDVDLAELTKAFGTRDYFRWQLELGAMPGVGEVRSEPCTALGADVPDDQDLPPCVMISFAILGPIGLTVRRVLGDFERRLGDAPEPATIDVGVSVTLQDTTPNEVTRHIAKWRAAGYDLLNHDEEALVRPSDETTLLYAFPMRSA